MSIKAHVIFDFDLTLVSSESLVDMLGLGLAGSGISPASRLIGLAAAAERVRSGSRDLRDIASLMRAVLHLRRSDIAIYVERTHASVGAEVSRLFQALAGEATAIHILSSSYFEWIAPLAMHWGVTADNITANRFYWLGSRPIAARPSPLHGDEGKCKIIANWRMQRKFNAPVILVGDSYTDYLPFKNGLVEGYISADYYRASPQELRDSTVRRAANFNDILPAVRAFVRGC